MNLSPETVLIEYSAPLWIFAAMVLALRFGLCSRWTQLSLPVGVELVFLSLAEIRFMNMWANNQHLFRHIVVLLSGYCICLGLSMLGHMWVLRRTQKKQLERSLALASLFFPGIYLLALLNLVFSSS